MNKKTDKILELALIRSIKTQLKESLNKGRLKNLLDKLEDLVDIELSFIEKITVKESLYIMDFVKRFGERTGWEGKEKSVSTLVSFCLTLIESSNFKYNPKIELILKEIFFYLENGNDAKPDSSLSGLLGFQEWRLLKNE